MMVSQILGTLVSPKQLINRAAKSSPGPGSRPRPVTLPLPSLGCVISRASAWAVVIKLKGHCTGSAPSSSPARMFSINRARGREIFQSPRPPLEIFYILSPLVMTILRHTSPGQSEYFMAMMPKKYCEKNI